MLSSNMEDYLEVIFNMKVSGKSSVRVRDIANVKNVSMPSVTQALKKIADQGYIQYSSYDHISLTKKGDDLASRLAKRHSILKRFFCDVLKVDEKIADRDACIVEHQLSRETMDALKGFCCKLDCGAIKL